MAPYSHSMSPCPPRLLFTTNCDAALHHQDAYAALSCSLASFSILPIASCVVEALVAKSLQCYEFQVKVNLPRWRESALESFEVSSPTTPVVKTYEKHGIQLHWCARANRLGKLFRSGIAMLLYCALIINLSILSMRISSFVMVCGHVMAEVGMFLILGSQRNRSGHGISARGRNWVFWLS